ncbi:CPCC family cysteine-rich protein [Chitinimonas sp. JJ19]|uniref:CPCC family cysteine-rich protein n=1 Tax=Chitinimonas sp. JJ19 TaxID=3109352 RepID=UPI0030035767
MTRNEAIDLLVRQSLAKLSNDEREALLLDWWAIDASDPDYQKLPDVLREAIGRTGQPDNPGASLYDPLLQVALRSTYVGVLNSYLTDQVATLGCHEVVDGDMEELATCPCCGYRSLRERSVYEICRVCFWEDDGTTETDHVSSPNHMTLREARLNVQCFGAVTESARAHVLIDGRERFASTGT